MQDLWDDERMLLLKRYFATHKSSKKAKQLVIDIQAIPRAVRNKIIKLYLDRCKIHYNIKFLLWRIKRLKELGKTEALGEKKAMVDNLIGTLNAKSKFLFEDEDQLYH